MAMARNRNDRPSIMFVGRRTQRISVTAAPAMQKIVKATKSHPGITIRFGNCPDCYFIREARGAKSPPGGRLGEIRHRAVAGGQHSCSASVKRPGVGPRRLYFVAS